MKFISKCLLVSHALALVCCARQNDTRTIIIKYPTGGVQEEIRVVRDSVRDGLTRIYYENGKIQSEIEYSMGVRNGWHLNFFPNGELSERVYFFNGKQYGDLYTYYKSGNIAKYNCIDFHEEPFYVMKFDSLGITTYEEGSLFSFTYALVDENHQLVDKEPLVLGKNYNIGIVVANPPGKIVKIRLYEIINNGEEKDLGLISVENNTAEISFSYAKPGNVILILRAEATDYNGQLHKQNEMEIKLKIE